MTKNKHVFFSEKDPEQVELFEAINNSGYNFSNMSRRLWMHLLWGTPLPGNMQQFQPIQQVQKKRPTVKQESSPPVLAPIGQVVKKKEDSVIKWVESDKKEEIPSKKEPENPLDVGMPLLD